VLSKPKQLTASRLQDLSYLRQNIHAFSRKLLQQQQQKLQHHETVVRLMSPTALLQKGFALVYHQGKLITNATALQSGEDITVQMVDASVQATIHTINSDGNESHI
jgi:exodeoxyribonuclease VII large subunit